MYSAPPASPATNPILTSSPTSGRKAVPRPLPAPVVPEIPPGLILASLAALVLTLLFTPQDARSAPGRGEAEAEPAVGLMFETEEPGTFAPAPLLASDIHIDVTGMTSRVRVRQFFENPTDHWLEARYVFPLSEKSAVDTLNLRIGEREIIGVIEERRRARAKYEAAKKDGKKAALLESERTNIFATSVANIGPGEGVVVEIEYQEAVRYSDGEFRLRFPMVVAPRYIPGNAEPSPLQMVAWSPKTDQVPDADRITPPVAHPDAGAINPVRLNVHLNGGTEFEAVTSKHHAVKRTANADGSMDITFAGGPVPADRDFELTWSAGNADAEFFAFKESREDADYAIFLLVPPVPALAESGDDPRPREFIFIIDTSGSMSGDSIRQAREALLKALTGLRPQDRFNVIPFNNSAYSFFPDAVTADEEGLELARRRISGLNAGGGTEMASALRLALDGERDSSRLRQIIFITDGAVGNEAALFNQIHQGLGDSRLFTVGIGSAPNSHFMRGAAETGGGTFTYIGDPREVETRMAALWRKIMSPVISDVRVEGLEGQHAELWPEPLPDLFINQPLVAALRWQPGIGTVTVTGRAADSAWSRDVDLSALPPGTGIAKLWAREKIASIENAQYRGLDGESARRQITDVALLHGLVSKYTSLVAIEATPSRPATKKLASTTVPTNLPAGWVYEKVFGDGATPEFQQYRKAQLERSRGLIDAAPVPLKASEPPAETTATGDGAKTKAPDATTRLKLPQTATPAELSRIVGFLLLLLALLVMAPPGVLLRRLAS